MADVATVGLLQERTSRYLIFNTAADSDPTGYTRQIAPDPGTGCASFPYPESGDRLGAMPSIGSRICLAASPMISSEAGRNGDQRTSLDVGQPQPARPGRISQPLEALTGDQREVLRLRVVVGLSAKETAAVLGTTADLIRILQHRALNQLRRILELE